MFQSQYRVTNNWSVNGHYTVQLENKGTYEGEATNQPGGTSLIGNYPEAFSAAKTFPESDLQSFQRNRFRLWSVYNFGMGVFGDASVSGLWRVEGARAYTLAARSQTLSSVQLKKISDAGYPDSGPSTQTVYYGDRGSERFKGYGLFDMSFNYNIPVWASLRPWIKFDVYDLFDNQKLVAWNTTISQNKATLDSLGLGSTYTKGPTFGKATGNTVTNLNSSNGFNTFPLAFSGAPAGGRTFRVAVGFCF